MIRAVIFQQIDLPEYAQIISAQNAEKYTNKMYGRLSEFQKDIKLES